MTRRNGFCQVFVVPGTGMSHYNAVLLDLSVMLLLITSSSPIVKFMSYYLGEGGRGGGA